MPKQTREHPAGILTAGLLSLPLPPPPSPPPTPDLHLWNANSLGPNTKDHWLFPYIFVDKDYALDLALNHQSFFIFS